jgi:hypothetical protein
MKQELIASAMELELPVKYCSSSFELKSFTTAEVHLLRGINSLPM